MNLGRSWSSPGTAVVRALLALGPWVGLAWLITYGTFREARLDAETAVRSAPRAEATVVAVGDDGTTVEYENPMTGRVVRTETVDSPAALMPGAPVTVAYDATDPYDVSTLQRTIPPDHLGWTIAGAIGALAAAVGAVSWGARRQRGLAASDAPAFRMIAAIWRPSWSLVPRMSLYSVDSSVGEHPVCTVRLADLRTRGRFLAGEVVDVKGLPRPGGLVIPRRHGADGAIAWPRGRALLSGTYPRPFLIVDPSAPLPPPAVPRATYEHRLPPPPSTTLRLRWFVVATLCGVACTVLVAALTTLAHRDVERWIADGLRGVAVVAERADQDFAVAVDVTVKMPDGSTRQFEAFAPADFPEDYEPGRAYPAVASRDLVLVRLTTEPYDPVEPVVWSLTPTAILAWHTLRRALGL